MRKSAHSSSTCGVSLRAFRAWQKSQHEMERVYATKPLTTQAAIALAEILVENRREPEKVDEVLSFSSEEQLEAYLAKDAA